MSPADPTDRTPNLHSTLRVSRAHPVIREHKHLGQACTGPLSRRGEVTPLAAYYKGNAEKPETLRGERKPTSILSAALEEFQLLLWHPVLHLVSTSPWWWVGDLYFRPAVLPDVVNIQFVIQVRLLERKRKYTSPQLFIGQGQSVQAQALPRVISESGGKEHSTSFAKQQFTCLIGQGRTTTSPTRLGASNFFGADHWTGLFFPKPLVKPVIAQDMRTSVEDVQIKVAQTAAQLQRQE